jgi:hypothetical protein
LGLYAISVASEKTRYNINVLENSLQHAGVRQQLQERLDQFMQIKQTDRSYTIVPFGTGGDILENAQDKARNGRQDKTECELSLWRSRCRSRCNCRQLEFAGSGVLRHCVVVTR